MKSEPHKRTGSPRSPFPGQRVDVTKTGSYSDEDVRIEREKLLSLCQAQNLPVPRVQVIGALSKSGPENSHYICTLVVGQRKFSSYPELYTSENSAKLAVLNSAIKFIERGAPQVVNHPSTGSGKNSAIQGAVDGLTDQDSKSNSKANIYQAQLGDVDMAHVVQDIYAENFNVDQISEAELYGDSVAEDAYVTENGYTVENAEVYGVPEAVQSEYQMYTYTEEYTVGNVTEDATYAAMNGVYGEVYEVAEQTNGGEQLYYPEGYSTEDQNLYADVTEVCENQAIDETGQLYTAEPTQEDSYTEEELTQYSEEQLAQYSEEQAAQYSEEQLAQYSEEQAAQYSEEQAAQYSEEQLAQYSEEQLAEYSEEPAVDGEYAEYSEEQYAQYAQVADEQGLDPTADPSQYYAEANAQVEGGDYGEVYEVIEASSEQVVMETQEYTEQQIEYDPTIQYDGAIYAPENYTDPAQAPLFDAEEASNQQIEPDSQAHYESGLLDGQEIYYDESGYAVGAYAEGETVETNDADAAAHLQPELTAQGSSETVTSVDSAFYDETVGASHNLQAGEQLIYETIEAALQDVYHEGVNVSDASTNYYGTELDQDGYAVAEQDLVDGMTALSLQSAAQGYQLDETAEVEYVTEYYEGETLEEDQALQVTDVKLPDEVDIYQLEQLPTDLETAGEASASGGAASETQEVPTTEYAGTEYVDPSYPTELVQAQYDQTTTVGEYQSAAAGDIDIYQVEELPTLSVTEDGYQSPAVADIGITPVEEVPYADAAIDDPAAAIHGTQALEEEYATEEIIDTRLSGSLQSRLQRALIVNISFDGHVTLNLYGPIFEAFSALEYTHKAEPVTACELNQWYAVDYDCKDGSTAKRAVAQYALEDGQSYMMHFLDEDFMSAVPLNAIFDLENPDEVSSIPPQGVTVEVMELTEKKVSPHTVEILLSQWLYKDVYIIPVDTAGAMPKVRLIDEFGELLNV